MNRKADINNVIWVAIAGALSFFSYGIIGFFISKILDMDDYASYQMYNLYRSYIGLLHFGFINGIYLQYGNLSYQELPQKKMRGYTWFLIIFQLLIQLSLTGWLCAASDFSLYSPLLWVILNIPLTNISMYFMSITRFTKRFVCDSKVQIILAGLTCSINLLLIVLRITSFVPYLCTNTFSNLFSLIIYGYLNKELIFGEREIEKQEIIQHFKRGIFINFSEIVGLLIINIDKLFVNNLCEKRDFAIYSFAAGIIILFNQVIYIFSKLFFPYLKRVEYNMLKDSYVSLTDILFAVSSVLICFIPLINVLIPVFLDKYNDSIGIISVLAPTVLLKSVLDLLFGNIYKSLDLEKKYFVNNIYAVVIAFLTNLIAWLLFGNLYAIAVASVISYVVWFLFTDWSIRKILNVWDSFIRKNILRIAMIALLLLCSLNQKIYVGYFLIVAVQIIVLIKRYKVTARRLFTKEKITERGV